MDELEKLKRELFNLEMKDKWDILDFQEADRLRERISDLETEKAKNGAREEFRKQD